MNVEVNIEPRDYDALGEYLLSRAENNRGRRVRYVAKRGIVVLVFVAGAMLFFQGEADVAGAMRVTIGFMVLMGVYLIFLRRQTGLTAKRLVAEVVAEEKAKPVSTRQYAVTEQGISLREDGKTALAPWETIADLVDTDEYLFVFGDREFPGVIPKRSFGSEAEAQQFFKLAHEYWQFRARL
jgi:hypothetical protein